MSPCLAAERWPWPGQWEEALSPVVSQPVTFQGVDIDGWADY